MELFLVSIIIILFTFLNSLSFIVGSLKAAPGTVFLGVVHYPLDYFYYLSQIIQGKNEWFLSYHLSTGEFTQKVLVGWVYVFFGRLFSVFSLSPIIIYQILVAAFSILFLTSSYLLIKSIFPLSFKKRIIAFIFFTTSNSFPKIIENQGKWTLGFYESWNNYGFPFIRLSSVPHHLLTQSLIILTLLLAISLLSKKSYSPVTFLTFLFTGLAIGSLQPSAWMILTLTLSANIILSYFLSWKKSGPKPPARLLLLRLIFAGIFFVSGIPFIIYFKQLFSLLPFSQAINWEATQQLYLPFGYFILLNGPLILLAIVGLPSFLRQLTPAKMVVIIYTLVSLCIFFSPLPQMMKVLNVRFLSAAYVLTFACIGTYLITSFRLSRKFNTLIQFATIAIILILTLPPFWLQMKTRLSFEPSNAYYYLPKDALAAFGEAQKISKTSDVFLILWPFEVSFSGVTGRRVFISNFIGTTNYGEKAALANKFFTGKMTEDEAQTFLRGNNIKYVLVYPWIFSTPSPFLTPVYQNNFLALYKVKEESAGRLAF